MKMTQGQVVHDLVEHMNHAQIADRIQVISQEIIFLVAIMNIVNVANIVEMLMVANIVSLLNMLGTDHLLNVHGHHARKGQVLPVIHPTISSFPTVLNLEKTVVYAGIELRYDFH